VLLKENFEKSIKTKLQKPSPPTLLHAYPLSVSPELRK